MSVMDAGLHTSETPVMAAGAAVTVIAAEPDLLVYPDWTELAVQLAVATPDGVKTPADVMVPPVAVHVTAEL
jgi:hypothetical protein